MQIDIVTVFPDMFDGPFAAGIVGRAMAKGVIDLRMWDLREFTEDRHRVVDDVPYGGGPGMVLKPEPFFRAVERIRAERGDPAVVVLLSPQGKLFTQADAVRWSALPRIVFLCGRYEGIDERVAERLVTEEVSIGDYVVSGGELPAMVLVDAVTRLLPGAVGDEQSVTADSFGRGLLDYPHYTRPAAYRENEVPQVLLSGHHGEIARWRKRQAVRRTLERRPELLAGASLDTDEQQILRELLADREKREEP